MKLKELQVGDRFKYLDFLWTYLDIDDGYPIARKHSEASIEMKELGYGYHDSICTFGFDDDVEFVPPNGHP